MKGFLNSLLSPDGEVSSKRWMGMNAIYFVMIVYFYTLLAYGFTEWHQTFIKDVYMGGLGLMGLTALDKVISAFKK